MTIFECRPPWSPDIGPEWTRLPVARLRFVASQAAWRLYWHDRNFRWHEDLDIAPSPRVDALLAQIEADPTGIYWG